MEAIVFVPVDFLIWPLWLCWGGNLSMPLEERELAVGTRRKGTAGPFHYSTRLRPADKSRLAGTFRSPMVGIHRILLDEYGDFDMNYSQRDVPKFRVAVVGAICIGSGCQADNRTNSLLLFRLLVQLVLHLVLQILNFVPVRSRLLCPFLSRARGSTPLPGRLVIVRVSCDLCAGLAGFLDLLELIVFGLLHYRLSPSSSCNIREVMLKEKNMV
ncbi:uncharacterized protein G2W53_010164 [Senna tora]|uniref:Uncharacterized protein n=1 Tax=Senna tora TaxID=362788 RepID=A0A835CB38_9FABA|nr:uncharacterized protein G2W53_010164 [Senna tora]